MNHFLRLRRRLLPSYGLLRRQASQYVRQGGRSQIAGIDPKQQAKDRWFGMAIGVFSTAAGSMVLFSLAAQSVLAGPGQPTHDLSASNIKAANREFAELLGFDNVTVSPEDCVAHSSTEWSKAPPDTPTASCMVYPRSTEEVSQVMAICYKRNIPVTPYSGGTSLHGALATSCGGVIVNLSQMDKILAIHEDDQDAVVQAGVGWQVLNAELNPRRLFFPPDPGPGAAIGGMSAVSCSGTNAYRYGTMKEWVISLTVVQADGTIVKTRQRPRKSAAGYDLTRLFVGSGGTLGIITEATVKITALPKNLHVGLAQFPDVDSASRAAIELVKRGVQLNALELMDHYSMVITNKAGMLDHRSRPWTEKPTLFLKFAGETPAATQDQIKVTKQIASQFLCSSFRATNNPEAMDKIWSARKLVLWTLTHNKPAEDWDFFSPDCAVPLSSMAVLMSDIVKWGKEQGFIIQAVAHAGDGNLHPVILFPPGRREDALEMYNRVQRRALELEGTITGEHGVGLELKELLKEEMGPAGIDLLRKIKQTLDPKCLLNCGKVIDFVP